MSDFEYKDYSSNDWGHSQDDHSDKELSKYVGDGSEKKLSKEEKKQALKLQKEAKAKAQSERRQKRLVELLAMEEAEKKNTPQNKKQEKNDKKLVPEDKQPQETQTSETPSGETTENKTTSEQPTQEVTPKTEVKAKKESEKEKGKDKEGEDSEKKNKNEKPEEAKDKLEATSQEGLEQAGQRLTDLTDSSKDGGIERVQNTLTETKDKASLELFQNSEEKLQGKKNSILFLKKNEQHKETASTKRKKSEQAVNEKPTEKQAEVQNKKVKEVATTKEPLLQKEASQDLLRQKMKNAMPTTMEQVDEFKENKDLGEVNEMVKGKITEETVKVQQTYQTIENPEKADSPKAGTPLPQKTESALPTNELGLGKDLLTPISDETLDTSQFTEEAQNLLDKEGITKEQLSEVKSGDLLEAKKELDTIDETAKAEPSKIKKTEKQEHASINQQLKSKEQTEKDKMRKERETGLRNAQSTQKDTKDNLEKKKEEVSKNINGIYERVNKSVLDRLARLEKDIVRKFDAVQAKAMQDFEKNVNKKIDAYKKERYGDSWFSWKKIKDWWTGIDNHPRVKQIFEEETKLFVETIDRAIHDLMNESKRVIDGCKQEVAKAKQEIAEYVKSLPLALQATGKEAQEKINKQLEELDKKIDKVAKELEATLQEKRKKAIEALNEKIEKMKENLGSALSKAGKFLLDAAFKFFKAVLEGMGYSMDDIMPYINKGKKILTSIVTEPGNFFSNLGKGVGGGISNFTTNIGTHLQTGVFDWLTGSMGGTGIQLPIAWDLGGVIFFVSQLLGVGWEQIKTKLGAQVGQENMAHLETAIAQGEEGMETVKKVQKEGVSGAMEVVQDQATEIKETAVSEIKTWAITAIIQAAIPKILSMFNPAGAIVQAILAIYKAVTWFVMNFERIIQWAKAVFYSIAHIASGAIGEATKKVEETMGRSLGLVITFLASQIGLGKVGDAIKKVIQKVRKPIEKVVDKVVKWIADKAKKLFKKIKGLFGKNDKKNPHKKTKKLSDTEVGMDIHFTVEKEDHHLWIDASGKGVEVMIASTPMRVEDLLSSWRKRLPSIDEKERENAKKLIKATRNHYTQTKELATKAEDLMTKAKTSNKPEDVEKAQIADNKTESAQKALKGLLTLLFQIFKDESGVMEKFKPEIAKIDSNAKYIILNAIEKNHEKLKNISDWDNLLKAIQTMTTDAFKIFNTPMSQELDYGKSMKKKAIFAFHQALKELNKPDDKKAELRSGMNEWIDNRIPKIHGKVSENTRAVFEAMENQITDDSLANVTTIKLKEYFLDSMKGNEVEEHDKFVPKNITVTANHEKITITYDYEVEVHGKMEKRSFTSFTTLTQLNGKEVIQQSTTGHHLVIKEPNTRGKTESVSQKDANKSLTGKTKQSETFHAAHVLADTFLGSGYKEALNLVTTSGDYNVKTMGGAEKDLVKELNKLEQKQKTTNPDNYITFDITVTAFFNELTDNEIATNLKTANPNMPEDKLKGLYELLQKKNEPKLCQKVLYQVDTIYLNGDKSNPISFDKKTFYRRIDEDNYLKDILI